MDMVRRLVWFAVVACAATFVVFLVVGNFVVAGAENGGAVPIRDVLSPGVHQLSGMILLPYECDELTVTPEEISTSSYMLVFQSWQDPSVICPETPTPRAFNTVVFAPSTGVYFSAMLDGKAFPIVVLPDIATTTIP